MTIFIYPGGQRDWVQVLCNGGVATASAEIYIREVGYGEHALNLWAKYCEPFATAFFVLFVVSSLACCCGDTWASEIGSVVGGTPRLITTWRRVPKGTNGGVTLIGTLCSIAGGLVVGIAYWIAETVFVFVSGDSGNIISPWLQYPYAIIGAASGLFGSLVDSILGATVQYSGYSEKLDKVVNSPGEGVKHISGLNILDNHSVNFLSSLITALVVPLTFHELVTTYVLPIC